MTIVLQWLVMDGVFRFFRKYHTSKQQNSLPYQYVPPQWPPATTRTDEGPCKMIL